MLKGVLTREDAITGANLGVAAIFVSNHGGRQLDGVPASVCLPKDKIRNSTEYLRFQKALLRGATVAVWLAV